MHNNENFENREVEDLDGQKKDKGIPLVKEKRTDWVERIALVTNIVCLSIWILVDVIAEPILVAHIKDLIVIEHITTFLLWLKIGLEIIAVFLCLLGLLIKPTLLLKRLLMIHVLFWLSGILYFAFLYGLVEFIFGWYK